MNNIFEREWYIQGFSATPLLLYFGTKGGADYMWNSGTGYEVIVNLYENDYCEMYYPVESLNKLYEEILSNPDIVDERIEISKKEWKIVIDEVERLRKIDFTEWGDDELKNEFYSYFEKVPKEMALICKLITKSAK